MRLLRLALHSSADLTRKRQPVRNGLFLRRSRASLYVAVRRPESMTSSSRSANPALTGVWPGWYTLRVLPPDVPEHCPPLGRRATVTGMTVTTATGSPRLSGPTAVTQ
jgi:hypothetical protein